MTRMNNNKGVALVFTLFTVVILIALSSIFVLRAVNENRMAEIERETAQSFYAANGGSQIALDGLDNLINNFLLNTIANSNPSGVINYAQNRVSDGDGITWLTYTVRDNGTPVLSQAGDSAEYTITGNIGDETYTYTIYFTEKADPSAVSSDSWDFPFNYSIVASSVSSIADKNISVTGDFTVRVQKDNFAKYALFTNDQTLPSGTKVWFTSKTNFDGPIHTNGRVNIALNPSGTFDGNVTQYEEKARFYNSGYNVLLDADYNGTKDVPSFNSGFGRDEPSIALSSSSVQQDMIDQATGNTTISTNGIHLVNNGTALTGGIFVKGDGEISMAVNGSNNAVYTIKQGSTTKVITVDDTANQTSIYESGVGTTTYAGTPDGIDDVGTIIYVDGDIDSIGGTIEANTQLTIASDDNINVQDHVRYENYAAASGTPGTVGYTPPNADGYDNLLGLVTWNGNVLVGNNAPDDVDIHGTILAQTGILQVDDYNDTGEGPRGTATLLGGVISDNYGAFGLFSGSTGTQLSGYGRNFVYDERMAVGNAPPYFPSLNTFIAFSNDITDKLVWQEGE